MILVFRFLFLWSLFLLSGKLVAQVNNPYNNNVEPIPKGREEQLDSTKNKAPSFSEKSKRDTQNRAYEAASYQTVQQQYETSYDTYTMNPNRKSMTEEEKQELNVLLNQMSKLEPENWLNLLAYYQIGQHDISRFAALEKVEAQKSKDRDLLNQVISYNAITSNENRLREDLVQLKNAGFYSTEVFHYAEDVLLSCGENSLLITHGFEDTHTALYVQKVMRKKSGVEIIDLDWFNSSFYRNVLKRKGYRVPNSTMVDVAFLQEFCVLNADKEIHLGLTLAKPYLNALLPNLYVQGLTFRFSVLTLELSVVNQQLWDATLTKKVLETCKHSLSVNYLPFLYQLRQYNTGNHKFSSYSKKKSSSYEEEGGYDQIIQRIIKEQNLPSSLKK